MIKFYLDNVEFQAPVNWEDLRLKLFRDRDVDTLLFTAETTFEWTGEAAKYLKSLIDSNGFCGTSDIFIVDESVTIYEGTIFLTSCEINEEKATIRTKVEDRSYYKLINNNKNVKTVLSVETSKDRTPIAAAERYLITTHDVSTGADAKEVYGVRVYEAFRFLIDFMSNGQLSFTSDTFAAGGEWDGLAITSGLKLRGTLNDDGTQTGYKWSNPPLPQISFQDLYQEVKKKIPIGITIENDTVRIEPLQYFFTDSTSLNFENIEAIITKFDEARLFGTVRVGSEKTEPATSFPFPETQNGIGFKDEQFASDIKCNIDRELNLFSRWVISSNVIQDCIENNADSYDDDIFLIDTTYVDANNGDTTRTDIFFTGNYFYNDRLRNVNVLTRYTGGVPSGLIQFNGVTNPRFEADSSNSHTATQQVNFNNSFNPVDITTTTTVGNFNNSGLIYDIEVNDPSNTYATSAVIGSTKYHVFTAPSDGLYGFEVFADFFTGGSTSGVLSSMGYSEILQTTVMRGKIKHELFTNTNTSMGSSIVNFISRKYHRFWNNGDIGLGFGGFKPEVLDTPSRTYTFSYYMLAGWKVVISPLIEFYPYFLSGNGNFIAPLVIDQSITLRAGSYIKCFSSSLDELNIPVTDINQYVARSHQFSIPLTQSEFELIKQSSRDLVQFSMAGQYPRKGWIEQVNYKYVEGIADFKLISNTNQ